MTSTEEGGIPITPKEEGGTPMRSTERGGMVRKRIGAK